MRGERAGCRSRDASVLCAMSWSMYHWTTQHLFDNNNKSRTNTPKRSAHMDRWRTTLNLWMCFFILFCIFATLLGDVYPFNLNIYPIQMTLNIFSPRSVTVSECFWFKSLSCIDETNQSEMCSWFHSIKCNHTRNKCFCFVPIARKSYTIRPFAFSFHTISIRKYYTNVLIEYRGMYRIAYWSTYWKFCVSSVWDWVTYPN